MQNQGIRSFIALDIDDKDLLDKFATIQKRIHNTGADLKLVELKNIHITFKFLGEVNPITLDKVKEEMDEIKASKFDIEFEEVGTFPNIKRPRVIWIGIKKGLTELQKINDQLDPKLRQFGFVSDRKGFSPHVTIARVRSGRNKKELIDVLTEVRSKQFDSMHAGCLRLKKSTLTPEGPIYTTIHEVKFNTS
ncbi:RNA 2',3'-cyclic phosphodiesterase [[Eubacterium] cellulosolvens]